MTTDDAPVPDRPGLDLDDGPLADALLAVDRALTGIETAKATLTVRRQDFARVFRAQVEAHADEPGLADDLRSVITSLYWDHATLRLTDLSAATGLDNDRIRRIAGPRRVEVGCVACGSPTTALQASRSDRVVARCPDCRRAVPDPFLDPGPWDPPGPSVPPLPDVDWLDRLLAHLHVRLGAVDCDQQLTLTRRWARREGMSQEAVVAAVQELGGFCDCEVVMNAPSSAGPGAS